MDSRRLATHAAAVVLGVLLGVVSGQRAARAQVVIDFNGLAAPHNILVGDPYPEDGYVLTSTVAGQLAVINGFQPNGLALRGTTAMSQVVRVENAALAPFNLLSVEVGDNSLGGSVRFTGSNGATRVITHSDLARVVNFAEPWRNLRWLDITVANSPSGAPGQLTADNIVLEPSCLGDFNGSGAVSVQDVFDFLAAYFATDPRADVNGVGGVTVQDIFDFLAAYFAGC